jgi:histidinol phosphatase-like enzyme (inositol monophosphatase family)
MGQDSTAVSGGAKPSLLARLDVALQAVCAAGECTLHYFNRSERLQIEQKPDGSVVTNADREAERIIRRMIMDAFPNDHILGEEFGDTNAAAEPEDSERLESVQPAHVRWIIDPIDGTLSYAHGVVTYGTLLAIERDDQMEIGIVLLPALDEIVWAMHGQGAHFQSPHTDHAFVLAHVSSKALLSECTICTTSIEYFDQIGCRSTYLSLADRARHLQGWGDSYSQVLVATGRADGLIEPVVKVWDLAAALVIIPEAGGQFTDWNNQKTPGGGNVIASNGHIHPEFLGIVRDTPAQP